MINSTGDTRYAYVNGIIRARESHLLTKGHFDRLVATDLTSYSTILSDTPYVVQQDLAASIQNEESAVRAFFNTYCLTEEVRWFLDWPEQIHNLKVKLKEGADDLLYPQNTATVESWPEILDEVARYAVDKDPFVLSTNLDKILCKYLLEAAEFAPFFEGYFQMNFELENIRSFFRARQFENKRMIMTQVYIPAGRLALKFLIENLEVAQDNLGRSFFNTPYAGIVDRGGSYVEASDSFLRLERLCDERRLGYLQQTRHMTFGVEPLFGYYHFKMSEARKLRQVYWGKMNEVSIDDLKESIPDVW